MPHDVTVPVRRNDDLGHGNFLVEFVAPEATRDMAAGQFFMIGIPGAETLLRRPYSVCGLPGTFAGRSSEAVQVLYRIIGRGTSLLGSLKAGAEITVLGPLGRGFSLPDSDGVQPVFVAGGIGSAPFPALAAALRGRARRPAMIYGARSAGDLPLLDWFEEQCGPVAVTTDDGSAGRRGLVTEPLAEMLQAGDPSSLKIYACGPEPMLRAVSRLALEAGAACELAMEAHMACGFGVCLGCVVPTHRPDGTTGYDRVCVEGPCMAAETIAW